MLDPSVGLYASHLVKIVGCSMVDFDEFAEAFAILAGKNVSANGLVAEYCFIISAG